MNIENKPSLIQNKKDLKIKKPKTVKEALFHCNANFNSQDGSLIIKTNNIALKDARRSYYLNKDGSGVLVTDWGKKEFPKDAFTSVLESAREIVENNGFMLSYENSVMLYKMAQEIASDL